LFGQERPFSLTHVPALLQAQRAVVSHVDPPTLVGATITSWQPGACLWFVESIQPSAGLPSMAMTYLHPLVPAMGGQL
jgi:hypothetical protein